MKTQKNLLLWLVLILLLIGTTLFAVRSWKKYKIWQSHKAYFEQAPEKRKIETWMTPNFIERHYKINITSELTKEPGFWDQRHPLNALCLSRQLDCEALVKKLNQQIGR